MFLHALAVDPWVPGIKELEEVSRCLAVTFVVFWSVVRGYHVYKGKRMCARASEILYHTADHLFIKRSLNIGYGVQFMPKLIFARHLFFKVEIFLVILEISTLTQLLGISSKQWTFRFSKSPLLPHFVVDIYPAFPLRSSSKINIHCFLTLWWTFT